MPGEHEILLVRHGETEWSSSGRHTSSSDIALTEHGRAQAAALAARLAGYSFVLVLTSPRSRAVETCELAGLGAQAEVTGDLAEWDYGAYEGRTTREIRERVPNWTIFADGAPGGESAARVGARADRVLTRAGRALDRAGDADGAVALFSHGHFLRVLGARWIGLAPEQGRLLGLDVATLSVLGYEREQRVLRMWNA